MTIEFTQSGLDLTLDTDELVQFSRDTPVQVTLKDDTFAAADDLSLNFVPEDGRKHAPARVELTKSDADGVYTGVIGKAAALASGITSVALGGIVTSTGQVITSRAERVMIDRSVDPEAVPVPDSESLAVFIRTAIDDYAGEHGITTGATAEQAAQIEQNTKDISQLSEEKMALPKDTDGNVIPGTVGWYAVSDGAGGITWVESVPSTGGGDAETTTHGIIWDLANVTSSNNAASVSDGASLVAVLTPADGYTLGDVTITMGGEVVTDCWNADTSTITIPSVTGDLIISCTGVVVYEEIPVTVNWVNGTDENGIFTENYGSPAYISHVELIDATEYDLKIHMPFDAEYCSEDSTQKSLKVYVYSNSAQESVVGRYNIETGEISDTTVWQYLSWDTDLIIPHGYYVRIFMNRSGIQTNALLLSYFQNHTVVYQVTPTASDSGVSAAQAVDADYQQKYEVSTLSLTSSTQTDTTTFEGVLEQAKNAWMVEYGGNVNKIPLIIHTDQHGHLNRSETIGNVFDSISSMVNWYDISKVINLGDTANSYDNPDDLTAGSPTLENYLDAMSEVPYSKRIEIFGNHDLAYFVDGTLTFIDSEQSYLQPYFRNIFARKTSNNGYFVVKDDNFNIKFVVLSGFEVDKEIGNGNGYIMSSKQIAWMIEELEKADGYDVIILSHVPLWESATETNPNDGTTSVTGYGVDAAVDMDALYSAIKNKTTGSVTDRYGISHDYDFSNRDGELLCSLHGHNHSDRYAYTGGVLLSATFQNFYASPRCLYFAIIDRENRQLNVWKVDSTPQFQNYQIPLDKPTE